MPAAIKELLLIPAERRQLINICVTLAVIVPAIDLNASHLDLIFSPKTSYTAEISVKEDVPCQKFIEMYTRNKNSGLFVIIKAEKTIPTVIKNIVLCRLLSAILLILEIKFDATDCKIFAVKYIGARNTGCKPPATNDGCRKKQKITKNTLLTIMLKDASKRGFLLASLHNSQ